MKKPNLSQEELQVVRRMITCKHKYLTPEGEYLCRVNNKPCLVDGLCPRTE